MRTKSLGGHIRCFSLLVCSAVTLFASEATDAFDLQGAVEMIAQEHQAKQQEGLDMMSLDWLRKAQSIDQSPSFRTLSEQAKQISGQANNFVPHAGQNQGRSAMFPKHDSPYRTLLFASHSLGTASLRDLLVTASLDPEAVVVFRGIPDESKDVMAAMVEVHRLGAEMDPMPNVILDPTLFRTYNITTVPTIVQLERVSKEGENVEVARVSGMTTTEWLKRQIAIGKTGDLGPRGPVEEISERDLIEVIKERVLAIDWNEKKEGAQARYWKNQRFVSLPVAPKTNVRRIDAAVAAREDILTHDGQVVAKKGVKVNPLAIRKWTQALVIFDPTIESQWKRIGPEIERLKNQPEVKKIVVIASEFDRQSGWDGYNDAVNRLNLPLYQLTPDIQRRFGIRVVPSVVTADDTHFIVKELGPITGE